MRGKGAANRGAGWARAGGLTLKGLPPASALLFQYLGRGRVGGSGRRAAGAEGRAGMHAQPAALGAAAAGAVSSSGCGCSVRSAAACSLGASLLRLLLALEHLARLLVCVSQGQGVGASRKRGARGGGRRRRHGASCGAMAFSRGRALRRTVVVVQHRLDLDAAAAADLGAPGAHCPACLRPAGIALCGCPKAAAGRQGGHGGPGGECEVPECAGRPLWRSGPCCCAETPPETSSRAYNYVESLEEALVSIVRGGLEDRSATPRPTPSSAAHHHDH
jgi:hypothetical protein